MIKLKIKRVTKIFCYGMTEPIVFEPKKVKEIHLNKENIDYIVVEK